MTRVVPFILQFVIKFIYLTNKKIFHYPKIDENESFIIAFWHGDLMSQPFNYKKLKPKGKMTAIVSNHKDGEIISQVLKYLGVGSIRGSSSKGGAKALISAIREIKKKGVDIAITPDGPRGPRHSVANGVVALSQKTNAKILVFNCKPSKYWQFNSWDRFVLPKPFGTLEFFVQEPLDISGLEMNEAKKLIKKKILENSLK